MPPWLSRLRRAGAVPAALLLVVTVGFLWWTNHFSPLRHWLLFTYAGLWLLAALFAVSSLVAGLRLLSLLLPDGSRVGERLLLGFALGVLTFFWGVFLAGALGLYGHVFFFAWPAALLAFGGPRALREARRWRVHGRRFGWRLLVPHDILGGLSLIVLSVGCVAVYLQVMTPNNVGADAVWYHLPVAEHYVAAGGLRPFREGWYNGALPQLASFLYTWAFSAPGGLSTHIALAAHVEFVLFLATLAGIAVLVRRLVPVRAPYAGALMFAFPGFLTYDSNLIIGADHVLAFWAPPLAIAMLRLARTFKRREAVLAGLVTAGALLTKYQGLYFLAPGALLLAAVAVKTRRLGPLLVWGVALTAASSAHWLKNWIFYGDPLYPMLHGFLPSHPFPSGAAELMQEVLTPPQFRFTGTVVKKLLGTGEVLGTFSMVPHDWNFHGRRPVFGSLFTCLLIALPFVRAGRRVWVLTLAVHLGIVVWFVTAHEDRYLQALLPWMTAASAALLVLLWRRGSLTRGAAVVVVAVQLLYGSDVYFYRVHGMIGDSPLKALVDFVSLGQKGKFQERAQGWGNLQANDLSKKMPKGAKALCHHFSEKLGLGVESVLDGKGWQGAIDYLSPPTPAATLALWRGLGVTHAVWDPDLLPRDNDVMAREAVFQRTLALYVPTHEKVGQYQFGALDPAAGKAEADLPTLIAWIGCDNDRPTGLYTPAEFSKGHAPADPGLTRRPALTVANVVLRRQHCGFPSPEVESAVGADFVKTAHLGEVDVLVRKRAP
jgi:hypothetical protein